LFVLDGSLITLHGQESRAELVILYPQAKVMHMKIGCGVTVASEMGRVAFRRSRPR